MRWFAIAVTVVLIAGCGESADSRAEPGGEMSDLPLPVEDSEVSLERTLSQRRSVRDFTPEPLTLDEISQLLWSAQGITSDSGGRTAPSAGGLYPLETYVVVADGWYRYVAAGHRLEQLGVRDQRSVLAEAALGQDAVANAAAVFVITAVYARTAEKYGARAERYVQLEAGHAAQNLLLQAVAEGLGAVPIGAFDDEAIQRVLNLPADHEPLYLVPVGHPAAGAQP